MLPLALVIVAGAVYLIVRRVEVRLVLLGAGLLMAVIAGKPLAITDTFTRAMVAEMVAPICAAMGFAAVLAATGCDRHLVHALMAPVRRVPWLLLPGGILVAYLVNMAVPSQTSTAAALGPILVPLMLAGGITAEVAGAALILGASFGGDLLHPAAQDVLALAGVTGLPPGALSARVVPASIAGAVVAALVFTLPNRRALGDRESVEASERESVRERKSVWGVGSVGGGGRGDGEWESGRAGERESGRGELDYIHDHDYDHEKEAGEWAGGRGETESYAPNAPDALTLPYSHAPDAPTLPRCDDTDAPDAPTLSRSDAPHGPVNPVKAAIPLVPVVMLLLAYGGWRPLAWLVPPGDAELAHALPVVRAMLIGTLLAALVSWREIQGVTRRLFEGMGEAYGSIISLTITARCFGAGLGAIGFSDALLRLIGGSTHLARLLAAAFPWALATLSGSGSGPILAFGETFLAPIAARPGSTDFAAQLGALACLAGAFGRTMSPVAAVVIYTSGLVALSPLLLVRRLLPALVAGATVALGVALLLPLP
jgi:C4-dicarboxylate transporter